MPKQYNEDDDFDERGVLKDGRTLRVGMQFRDSDEPPSACNRDETPPCASYVTPLQMMPRRRSSMRSAVAVLR